MRIPVVYVTVPPAATPRILAVEFAQFLGIATTRSWNQADCQILTAVRLHRLGSGDSVVLLTFLLMNEDFCLLDQDPVEEHRLGQYGLFEGLPDELVETATAWEAHIVEVETGRAPGAADGVIPRPGFDPAATSVQDRVRAKVTELAETDMATSFRSLMRMRARYRDQGLVGLVDPRRIRTSSPVGQVDPRVVEAVARLIESETNLSTGTKARLWRKMDAPDRNARPPATISQPRSPAAGHLA